MWLIVGTDPEANTTAVGIKFSTTLHRAQAHRVDLLQFWHSVRQQSQNNLS